MANRGAGAGRHHDHLGGHVKIDGMDLNALRDAAETAITVAAAHRAGLLRALAEGPGTATEIARRAGLDARATRIVLGALEDFGAVTRGDGEETWSATEACRRTLCEPDHPDYAGGGLDLWLRNIRGFTGLPAVLASGEPVERAGSESDEEALRRYMSAMAAAPGARVRRIVDACLDRVTDPRRVLDLGGGPGHMARAFVERGLEVTLVDTAETVAFTGREYGLADVEGLDLVGRDFHEDPLPPGPFDVVLLSNVAHIYPAEANRALLGRVAGVTAPGGVVAVMDFVRGRSPRAARFALVMLLRTEGGDTWTAEEIEGWMSDAGLGEIEVTDVDDDRQLVSGVRPG